MGMVVVAVPLVGWKRHGGTDEYFMFCLTIVNNLLTYLTLRAAFASGELSAAPLTPEITEATQNTPNKMVSILCSV